MVFTHYSPAFRGRGARLALLAKLLNVPLCRMRSAEHAPRVRCRLLERRDGLAEIVERGAGVVVERPRSPFSSS